MKEKIKIIYLILGIPLLILTITVLAIWISKQINWEFFTFNKKECISEYLSYKYEANYIRNLSDKQIKEISQIWSLNKEEMLAIKEREKISYEKHRKEVEECMAEFREKEGNMFAGLFQCEEPEAGKISPFTSVKDFTENKKPIITNSLVKELRSEGICPRPSLLK